MSMPLSQRGIGLTAWERSEAMRRCQSLASRLERLLANAA
jgi:hypothetical protein